MSVRFEQSSNFFSELNTNRPLLKSDGRFSFLCPHDLQLHAGEGLHLRPVPPHIADGDVDISGDLAVAGVVNAQSFSVGGFPIGSFSCPGTTGEAVTEITPGGGGCVDFTPTTSCTNIQVQGNQDVMCPDNQVLRGVRGASTFGDGISHIICCDLTFLAIA